jgi:glycosyltransferase involved in cell wall biosynthesis
LEDQVEELDIARQVTFTGPVLHERIADYFAAGDLFIFPSVTETQGMVLVEAMAAGTPVVAVEAPGSVDTLSEGGGVLVPTCQEEFVDAVLALLSDPGRRERLGREARQVADRYTVSEATARLVEVYERAVTAGPAG